MVIPRDIPAMYIKEDCLSALYPNSHFVFLFLIAMKRFLHPFKSSHAKSEATASHPQTSSVLNMNPLTVVELFQSQGCSSCPPTNSNVLKLVDDPNMLVLTYDVTYWDKLGWKDTFGKSAFDQRQWEYARALQRRNVFTPQVRCPSGYDFLFSFVLRAA